MAQNCSAKTLQTQQKKTTEDGKNLVIFPFYTNPTELLHRPSLVFPTWDGHTWLLHTSHPMKRRKAERRDLSTRPDVKGHSMPISSANTLRPPHPHWIAQTFKIWRYI
ncbi:hypothetical protein GBA52_016935 [Prunus armeniaca]|nr:hypothetical protein GBA52_016935 [Prunus armeniaca]